MEKEDIRYWIAKCGVGGAGGGWRNRGSHCVVTSDRLDEKEGCIEAGVRPPHRDPGLLVVIKRIVPVVDSDWLEAVVKYITIVF